MDAYLTENHFAERMLATPPILIAADSAEAMKRARHTIDLAGLRIADAVRIEAAPERIERQAAVSALWIELDQDCGGAMDTLLDHVQRDVRAGRYAAVVSATEANLDPVAARLSDPDVVILVGATEAERTAALALAAAGRGQAHRVADVASDRNAVRLRQLSDEVSRIASTLARLSTGPQAADRPVELPQSTDLPEVSAETVHSVIRARRLRARFLPEELFADPAWDMLLDLLQAEIAQLRVPVSSLCIAAAVPATTALRWLKTMTEQGLFVRRADPHDGRRVFVELAPQASQALRCYFAEVGKPVTI